MVKIHNTSHLAVILVKIFTTQEWNTQRKNMKNLINAVASVDSSKVFIIELPANGFSWEEYIKNLILGTRQYIFKESMDTLPEAKKKLKK